jgi:hypothetical protein
MDLKETGSEIDERLHWYFQTKKVPLLRYFGECSRRHGPLDVVDIGAGSGFFSGELERRYGESIGRLTLVDSAYTSADVTQAGPGRATRTTLLPAEICGSFLVMMDVLEHLDNDRLFLADLRGRLSGENPFFITVPAFDALWSGHDVYLGHRRRYTLAHLRALLGANGFEVKRGYYLYASIFPLVYMARMLKRTAAATSDLAPVHPWVNALLTRVLSWEMAISRRNGLFGVTCVAEGSVHGR